MWLMLCSSLDEPAVWLAARLRRAGLRPVYVVTPEMLCFPRASRFHLQDDGVHSRLELLDGTILESKSIRGVINRIDQLPETCFTNVGAIDREHASLELAASLSSWLFSLHCPVINPPSPEWIGGRRRSWLEWTALAAQVGLDSLPSHLTCHPMGGHLFIDPPREGDWHRERILVCGSWCAGEFLKVPAPLGAAAIRLARLANMPLLELEVMIAEPHNLPPASALKLGTSFKNYLSPNVRVELDDLSFGAGLNCSEGPWLCGVNSRVDFRRGGAPLLETLVRLLTNNPKYTHDSPLRHTRRSATCTHRGGTASARGAVRHSQSPGTGAFQRRS